MWWAVLLVTVADDVSVSYTYITLDLRCPDHPVMGMQDL